MVSKEHESLDHYITENMYQPVKSHHSHSSKRQKTVHLVPIVFAKLQTLLGIPKTVLIKCLVDTGSSGTILFTTQKTTWNTSAGDFTTNGRSTIQFTLPEFYDKSIIEHEVHITSNLCNVPHTLGLALDCHLLGPCFNRKVTTNRRLVLRAPDAKPHGPACPSFAGSGQQTTLVGAG